MGGYVRCYAWFDEWYVSFNRFGRRKFVKFDNIYVFLFEKSVLINLLITSKYRLHENFYPLENIWSVFYSFRNIHREEECGFFEISNFFYARKLDFLRLMKLRNDIAWWLKISIKIQFYTNNYSRGEKIHVM